MKREPQHKVLTEAKRLVVAKVVTTNKAHTCAIGGHEIPAKSEARYEATVLGGKWRTGYACLPCIDARANDLNSL